MSNDLLFSNISRNSKVSVKSSGGVTRIKKDDNADRIHEDSRENQQQKHQAEHEAFKQSHKKPIEQALSSNDAAEQVETSASRRLDTFA